MSTPTKLIVKLKLSPDAFASLGFGSPPAQRKAGSRSKSTTAAASPLAVETKPTDDSVGDNASESNATPGPTSNGDSSALTPSGSLKRKGVPGPKPGHKRMPPAILIDSLNKPRGKPGPKKRKLDGETGSTPAAPAHKLGPKANQGAINAGLRALDRSGAPCRKWHRQGFSVKSFTGVSWGLPSWHGLAKASDSTPGKSEEDSSDQRPDLPSSAVGSEDKSDDAPIGNAEVASSPAPAASADVSMVMA